MNWKWLSWLQCHGRSNCDDLQDMASMQWYIRSDRLYFLDYCLVLFVGSACLQPTSVTRNETRDFKRIQLLRSTHLTRGTLFPFSFPWAIPRNFHFSSLGQAFLYHRLRLLALVHSLPIMSQSIILLFLIQNDITFCTIVINFLHISNLLSYS